MNDYFQRSLRAATPAEILVEDLLLNYRRSGQIIISGGFVFGTPDDSLYTAIKHYIDHPDEDRFDYTLFRYAKGWEDPTPAQIEERMRRGRVYHDHRSWDGRLGETKQDGRTWETGRAFVQIETDGLPSGIAGPEGDTDIWHHCICNQAGLICGVVRVSTPWLREVALSGRYPIVETHVLKVVNKGALIPFNDILDHTAR